MIGVQNRVRDLVLIGLFTLALHVPFLNRPIHFDEVQYLDIAANIFDHPATPTNFDFIFMGMRIDMAGHPHPPLNAYMLAALWSLRGQMSPRFFHAAYLVFPLTIALSAYFIAGRFTRKPLWVAVLVAAAPLVAVSANSLDTDSPALAFLLAGAACFLARRFIPAGILFTCAGFTALQALAVILLLMFDFKVRGERPPAAAWIAVATPFAALGAWQCWQWIAIGRLPAWKLAGYMTYAPFQRLALRRDSMIVLTEHLGALVVFAPFRGKPRQWIPALLIALPMLLLTDGYPWWECVMLLAFVAIGVRTLIWLGNRVVDQPLLAGWCLGYFAFALVVFYIAGAARYLMPLSVPLAILFVLQNEQRAWRLAAALAISLFLGMNLAYADYDLARLYAELPAPLGKDFLVNGEWGFRYYMTQRGGRMIEPASPARAGQWIVKSELAVGSDYGSPAESRSVVVETRDLFSRTPFRVIDRYAHSGFETAGFGRLPFSFSLRPVDRITYSLQKLQP